MGSIAALLATLAVFAAGPLSPELEDLASIADNEALLVETVRRFDLQQQALIEWDRELAQSYAEEGKNDLAQTKADDIEHRIDLIGEAWNFARGYYHDNARVNNYLGEFLYDFRGDTSGALRYWKLALNLDKKLGAVHNNLAIHYFHVGDYDRGLHHVGRALKLEPKNPDYLFNVAQMYLIHFPQIGERYGLSKATLYEQAMRHSRDAARYAPDDYALLLDYAVNFFASENFGVNVNWENAAQAWERARERAPTKTDHFYTLLNEGRVWIRAEQWDKAAQRLQEALQARPESAVAQKLLEEARANAAP